MALSPLACDTIPVGFLLLHSPRDHDDNMLPFLLQSIAPCSVHGRFNRMDKEINPQKVHAENVSLSFTAWGKRIAQRPRSSHSHIDQAYCPVRALAVCQM
jgi:hypothetical protein